MGAALKSLNQYGHSFQQKVIHCLIYDKEFLITVFDILDDSQWESPAHKWLIKEVANYYKKYKSTLTLDILKIQLDKLDNKILQISIREQLKLIVEKPSNRTFIKDEFLNFCKNQKVKTALLESVELLNSGDFDDIRNVMVSALQAGQNKDAGHDYAKSVEERYRKDNRITVPTPWPIFNQLLQGGLGNGDLGIIFGNPGGGKSWTLMALGAHAFKLGYKVLHYTLELGEGYVGKRYDANILGIPVNEIDNEKHGVEEKLKEYEGELIIKEYSPGKATIATLEANIEKHISMGFEPDLIIIDYLDLLSSGNSNRERKDDIDKVYVDAKGLAKERNLPVWSVSQVNRAGAQDNVIEGDKAAGSYDKLMISDFCASASRGAKDKIQGTARFHIMKNRYNGDGMTYNATMDTSMGHIEIKGIYNPQNDAESNTMNPTPQNHHSNYNHEEDNRKKLREEFFKIKETI
jgi:replicative DNA helicase